MKNEIFTSDININIKDEHKSLEQKTYEVIKNMILFGRLKANTRLIEEKMAHDLGVSRTTVKKAFIRLKENGLLDGLPWQGVQVRLLSTEEVLEAYEVREVLEGLSARIAARSLSDDEINRMLEIFKKLKTDEHEIDVNKYAEADFNLHELIANSCKNRLIPKLIVSLIVQIRFFQSGLLRDSKYTMSEHIEILEALKNHDENLSETLMRRHIKNLREAFLRTSKSEIY